VDRLFEDEPRAGVEVCVKVQSSGSTGDIFDVIVESEPNFSSEMLARSFAELAVGGLAAVPES
jgi:hypothetical protein